jgi:signal peptidase
MPKRPSRDEEDEDEKDGEGWKAWVRDIAIAVLVMVVILAAIFAYTQVWPPLVVVESSSMQHGDQTSYIGVIDTGDLVFVQAAPNPSDVITYVQGRATGYSTYGDYGDVIIFRLARDPSATPIIHRAIMYVLPNGTNADVPTLAALPATEWQGFRNGVPVSGAYNLSAVTIHEMGYNHDLGITFNLAYFANAFRQPGYITMGDNNAYHACIPDRDPCSSPSPYDTLWFPSQRDLIGHARGEIPWFGLIKLLIAPADGCAPYWGAPCAPQNSWNDLAIALVVLIALPFIVEAAGWAWGKYAWPRIKPLFRRKGKDRTPPPEEAPAEEETSEEPPGEDEPKEGSSGP